MSTNNVALCRHYTAPSLPFPLPQLWSGPELVAKPSRNTTEKRLSFNQLRRLRTLAKACLSITPLPHPPSATFFLRKVCAKRGERGAHKILCKSFFLTRRLKMLCKSLSFRSCCLSCCICCNKLRLCASAGRVKF